MTQTLKIALIGGGHMGGALAAGWLRTKRSGVSADSLVIVDPAPGEPVQDLVEKQGVRCVAELDAATAAEMDLVVLAVKPQTLEAVAAPLAPLLGKDAALISIMAGVTLNRLAMAFGDRAIVRVMPNMPASVGAGVSVCVANDAAEKLEKTVTKIFKPVG